MSRRTYTLFSRSSTIALAALLAVACLLALPRAASALPVSWEDAPIAVNQPGAIATDGAGRIYVPLRGAGRVNVYDNARGSNAFLASIGIGRLVDPIAVAIDRRGYIYVADASLGAIVAYTPYYWGAPYLASSGVPGAALGQFDGIRQIAIDAEPRVYAAEAGNARVQSLDAARGVLSPLYAFGVSEPGAWGAATGLALDSNRRVLVSSSDPSDSMRMYAENGTFLGDAIASGSAAGQISAPQGLSFDSVDRLLVADSGNNRIQVFSAVAAGLTSLSAFGSFGSGVGQFNQPGSIAQAPGALLYVADYGNNRIVRLRYDDADLDGALDARDNCPGLSNAPQGDVDSDSVGDACDLDIDGDALANPGDSCPQLRPFVDLNRDGCQDPFSTLSQLLKGKGKALRVSGRADGGSLGVARVEVAIALAGTRPVYRRARGTTKWSFSLPRRQLAAGRYWVYVRAVQARSGLVEATRSPRSSFSIRR